MRHSWNSERQDNPGLSILSLVVLALIAVFMLPSQVYAASCNTDLKLKLRGPGNPGDPIFVEDIVNATMILSGADLENGTYIDIPNFGFASDCEADTGLTFDNCVGQQNAINFGVGDGLVSAACLSDDEANAVEFPPLQSNRVAFIPKDGRKMRLYGGDVCAVSWDFQVTNLWPFDEPPKMAEMWQVVSFPLSKEYLEDRSPPVEFEPAECSNGLVAVEDRQARIEVHTCEVEIEKQICAFIEEGDCALDSDEGWEDADSSPGLMLGANGKAVYRAIVKNTGSADFLGDISFDDDDLGISGYTVDWDPDTNGEMVVGNHSVFNQNCDSLNPIDNTLEVTAWCRTTAGAEKTAEAADMAWGDCDNYRPPNPKLSLEKVASPQTYEAEDDPITYTYTLTNIGNVTLWPPYTVVDDKINTQNKDNGGSEVVVCEDPNDPLPVNGEKECTATYFITAADLEAGKVTNVANATAKDAEENGKDVPAGPVEETVTGPPPVISVEKDSKVTSNNDGTWDVEYTVKVSNTGAKSGTYTLEDQLSLDDGLFFEKIVSNIVYDDAGSTDSLAGTVNQPDEAGFLNGFTIIEDETIAADTHEQYKFTLQFSIDGVNATANGPSCELDQGKEGDIGLLNEAVVKVPGSKDVRDEVCDAFPLEKEIELIKEIWDEVLEEYVPTAGPVAYPSGATYRMMVRNRGEILLTNVTITDPDISDTKFELDADLPVNGPYVIICDELTDLGGDSCDEKWAALADAEVCESSGSITNVATAEGQWDPEDASKTVTDTGQATLICAGDPKVEIKKQVSVDGGQTWYDADDEEGYTDYPNIYYDPDPNVKSPVEWRVLIYNVGDVVLDPATLDDLRLWVGTKDIGPLAVTDDPVIFTSLEIQELSEEDVCKDGEGSVTNLAGVTVTEAGGSESDRDTDTAGVVCVEQPAISIVKEASYTGDPDEYANSVTATAFADGYWRFIITNEGGVDLTNVHIVDEKLGINTNTDPDLDPIALLPANGSVTIDYGTTGYGGLLKWVEFCSFTFDQPFVNTAKVTADPANGGASVSDTDTATYDCVDERVGDICYDDDGSYLGKPNSVKIQYDPDPNVGNIIADPGTTPIIITYGDFPVGNTEVDIYIFDSRGKRRDVVDEFSPLPLQSTTFSGPKGMVAPNTLIEIYGDCEILDGPGCAASLIQTVEFHTSCSQVISAGDKYGAIRIIKAIHD